MDSNQSPLADPVFYRTYSRRQGSDRETWAQATDRAIGGLIKLGKFTPAESDLLRDQCLRMRALPAGRWLWVGGTPWIEAPENYPGAFNCHNSHLRPSPLEETGSPWEVMGYLMQLAMMGCGVGRVCSLAGAAEFPLISRSINVRIVGDFGDVPKPDRQDETTYAILSDGPRITIGDSRQGWADAYQSLLEIASGHHPIAHADPGHPIEVAVDISHVRPSGERLAGFGGVANPIKLPDLFGRVAKILNHAIGRKLTPLELALISDEAALVVVAGNIRRSAGIIQFDSEDSIPVDWLGVNAATAKHGLWVQGEDGSWAIDPNRDALRMSNHTKVFMRKPTEQECIESVRSQYYSGEGAIQYAPEEIARANRDLLDTPEKRRGFFRAIEIGPQSAKQYLLSLMPPLGTDGFEAQRQRDQELDHRVDRYGLNPCFGAGTMIMVRDSNGVTQQPIESLIGKTVEVFDGERWVVIDNFRVTGRNRPMLRIELQSGQSVRTTEYHDFILEDGTRKKAKDLDVGDQLLHMTDDEGGNDLGWFYTVAAIAPDGVDAEVYCCTVPTNHQITLGSGLITGQCGEATGSDFFCNLSTVCLNQLDPRDLEGQEEAFRAAGLFVAALLQRGFDRPRYQFSREIDPIVLVSFTGGFDFFVKLFGADWLSWWEAGRPDDWKPNDTSGLVPGWSVGKWYKQEEKSYLKFWRTIVERTIWEYCDRHGLRRPNRCTGLKPEGTLSLLTGASPGWHPPKAARFIRRVTFAKNDPIALACLDHGYSIVPSQSDKDENGNLLNDPFDPRCTEWLVEIPVAVSWADLPGADTIAIEKFSALAQFDFWMQVQKHYTTHSTSATIELRESEIEPLGQRIYQAIQEDEGYISAALLSRFDDLQTFPRLPFEPISREIYLELQSAVESRRKPGTFAEHLARHDQGDRVAASEQGPAGCDSDRCLLPERK